MKNSMLKKMILPVLGVFLLSGCAMHSGYMTGSAALSSNNFSYIKRDLEGESTALYVFGLGGLAKAAIMDEAKRDLLAANPLGDNQALANVTVSWKYTYVFPFAMTNKCTVTADIVEFK